MRPTCAFLIAFLYEKFHTSILLELLVNTCVGFCRDCSLFIDRKVHVQNPVAYSRHIEAKNTQTCGMRPCQVHAVILTQIRYSDDTQTVCSHTWESCHTIILSDLCLGHSLYLSLSLSQAASEDVSRSGSFNSALRVVDVAVHCGCYSVRSKGQVGLLLS